MLSKSTSKKKSHYFVLEVAILLIFGALCYFKIKKFFKFNTQLIIPKSFRGLIDYEIFVLNKEELVQRMNQIGDITFKKRFRQINRSNNIVFSLYHQIFFIYNYIYICVRIILLYHNLAAKGVMPVYFSTVSWINII